ncbi:MAG: hypothetical protein LBL84_01695 [Candidatus Nomurabacteria bacterium]|jgi:hypothetical protein|nr:hypothetical protein [Candidatus Nomurabacteria bacterium]
MSTNYAIYDTEYDVMIAVRKRHPKQIRELEIELKDTTQPADFSSIKTTADEGIKDLRLLRDRYIITIDKYNRELQRYMRRYTSILASIRRQSQKKTKMLYYNNQCGRVAARSRI